jgi:hypothetical protein
MDDVKEKAAKPLPRQKPSTKQADKQDQQPLGPQEKLHKASTYSPKMLLDQQKEKYKYIYNLE